MAGLIAPARMNGVISTAWFASAYALAAPSIVASHTIGELAFASETMTVFVSRKSAPKRIRAIATVSSARLGCVTEPMNALSE